MEKSVVKNQEGNRAVSREDDKSVRQQHQPISVNTVVKGNQDSHRRQQNTRGDQSSETSNQPRGQSWKTSGPEVRSHLVSIEDPDYQSISSPTRIRSTPSRSAATSSNTSSAFLSRNDPSVTDASRAVSVTSSDESVTDSATEQDSLLRSKRSSAGPSSPTNPGGLVRSNSGRSSGRLSRNRSRNNDDRRCKFLCCLCYCVSDGFSKMGQLLCKKKQFKSRQVPVAGTSSSTPFFHHERYPSNVILNQKYNVITFLPVVLFNQFKFFLNLYFLLMACSQFINELKVGYPYTYWAPLGFVLAVTVIREAVDDFLRYKRDKAINSQLYQKLTPTTREVIPSSKIKVGDLILVYKDQRVPADMILLKTTEKTGACFIRTDQLDGETDWKLRLAVSATQQLKTDEEIFAMDAFAYAEEPRRDIHSFTGTFTVNKKDGSPADKLSLSIENTLWANTVVASGTAVGLVVYTGTETRSVMNNLEPRSKVGLLDYEVNDITKVLFAAVVVLAFAMICLKGFNGPWYRYWFRFLLLFSYIIPISLRVNLEIGRVVYSYMIQRDIEVPGIVVRTTTIPEDLGRLSYLLTDKTGTLTRNEMVFKRIHLGKVSYTPEYFDEVAAMLKQSYAPITSGQQGQAPSHRRQDSSASNISIGSDRKHYMRHTRMDSDQVDRDTIYRVNAAVTAIALCHNVTPSYDNDIEPSTSTPSSMAGDIAGSSSANDSVVIQLQPRGITYQASSPDEVALVQWTERVGLALVHRDLTSMQLQTPSGALAQYDILQIFPFSSDTKRMGIIVRDTKTREILFLLKGADVVMVTTIQYSDWLQEQCDNMARSGLRTLVVARKFMSEEQYQDFESRYNQAKLSIHDRAARMRDVMATLEKDMELLCLTGVEDRLQEGVPTTLKGLQDAGIKIWMLTGDKLETAISIAKSSQLVKKMQEIYVFRPAKSRTEAHIELNNFHRKNDCPLIIRGEDLEVVLKFYSKEFMEIACHCPAVVCCRCSPTQKAEVVRLIQTHTKKRTCAVGDGGNDVSMIQTADVGVGIVGKEGQQASLAADFSIMQFSHIYRLILLHGRYSYKRSATLSQFIFHRGLIISTLQAIFSSVFYFASVSLYQGFLMIGYATIYTMFPVFSIVLDKDVSPKLVMRYPELYKLMKGRSLSYKTFFIWVLISIYQGGVIMYGAMLLFLDEFIHVVAITFTAVILTELLMLALTVRTWHWMMLVAELVSLSAYLMTLIFQPQNFDEQFIQTFAFLWKVCLLTVVSCLPLYVLKFLHRKIAPPSHCKLT